MPGRRYIPIKDSSRSLATLASQLNQLLKQFRVWTRTGFLPSPGQMHHQPMEA
jgi:hypothetical protein